MTEYRPIADYGIIGDLRTAALISREGTIDWCCLPHFDSPSIFAALLDRLRGGTFSIRPVSGVRAEQRYIARTNVLQTIFATPAGRLAINDFMPLRGSLEGCAESETTHTIYRILQTEGSAVEVEVLWAPRMDYARAETRIEAVEGGWRANGGEMHILLGGLPAAGELLDDGFGPAVKARFTVTPGEPVALALRWNGVLAHVETPAALDALEETVRLWRDWVDKDSIQSRGWAEPHTALLVRAELVLKLLSHAGTGAIVAAPTTSLPETIGGVRNWDYRYTWIRDAALTAQALVAVGHKREAIDWLHWVERISQAQRDAGQSLRIMYGLHGEVDLTEIELEHLEGYRGSRPVRIGNGAAEQIQLDIYGDLLNAAYELVRSGEPLQAELWGFLCAVADMACEHWQKPDYGIWEMRGPTRHFVYSKVMIWVALDRALRLAKHHAMPGDTSRWRKTLAEVREVVLRQGYNDAVGAFVQSFDSTDLDASNLLIPLYDFLPFDDPRVQSTIDRTIEGLTENGLVYRYKADDGLPGKEGAFGLCTFWLVDNLALSGRLDEAHAIFEGMVSRANHLGLFAEQFDAVSGEHLGNFPQAFSHIGLINSALYLAHAEGRETPIAEPMGSDEHRADTLGAEAEQPS
ncbi:MAG: glycoside hydrolase family 15 protein [Aggregatilineales bacterium]